MYDFEEKITAKAAPPYLFYVSVELREQLVPELREKLYAKPLQKALDEAQLGSVRGGLAVLAPREKPDEKNIEWSCLDVVLANLDDALSLLKQTLTALGAPVGSQLVYPKNGQEVTEPVGENEVLQIFIPMEGVDFPKIQRELKRSLEGAEQLRGPLVWPSESMFYLLGPNADEMFKRIESLPQKISILQQARVVFQRRDATKEPKETRFPAN